VAAAALDSSASGTARAVLATWPELVDAGRALDGDDILRQTARPPVARLSKQTAAGLGGMADGDLVQVSTDRGWVRLPAAITEMADGVVWLPTNPWGVPSGSSSDGAGAAVRRTLGVTAGAVVTVARHRAGGPPSAGTEGGA
jgi:NADH-quinone oxidoreductase subunit G